jgi:hypothetical protein
MCVPRTLCMPSERPNDRRLRRVGRAVDWPCGGLGRWGVGKAQRHADRVWRLMPLRLTSHAPVPSGSSSPVSCRAPSARSDTSIRRAASETSTASNSPSDSSLLKPSGSLSRTASALLREGLASRTSATASTVQFVQAARCSPCCEERSSWRAVGESMSGASVDERCLARLEKVVAISVVVGAFHGRMPAVVRSRRQRRCTF